MDTFEQLKNDMTAQGFANLENVLSEKEITSMTHAIDNADCNKPTFLKTKELFAIRKF